METSAMNKHRTTLMIAIILFTPAMLAAQTASPENAVSPIPLKTIGQARPTVLPSLIVFNSRGATLQGNKLVLAGVTPTAIIFADRPARSAGHDLTAHIVEDWSKGSDNFTKDPPNATVSAFRKDGLGITDAVVVLKNPKLEGDQLTFDVDVLEGDLQEADGAAAVFIDILGLRYPPAAFTGVFQPTASRGAYYASNSTATFYNPQRAYGMMIP
jgi:hypothetical protein